MIEHVKHSRKFLPVDSFAKLCWLKFAISLPKTEFHAAKFWNLWNKAD